MTTIKNNLHIFTQERIIIKTDYKQNSIVCLTSTNMEYLYYFANANLTLRIFEYLYGFHQMPVAKVTVIHQTDGWLVRVKMYSTLNSQQDHDFRAYLNEFGIPSEPSSRLNMVFLSLEAGHSPLDIMRRYHVVVVSHGSLQQQEIETFRRLFVSGLG